MFIVRLPKEPKDAESKKFYNILKDFVQNDNLSEHEFPTDLNSTQRKL